MRWIVTEWEACAEETINKCFPYCFKHDHRRVAEVEESGGADLIRGHMKRKATEHRVSFTRAIIDALLNPGEEDYVV